jgi:2-succinyl-5-enolpyruvyl-6-hydroxy-3-cyclohexene-1-carboxylate synthase
VSASDLHSAWARLFVSTLASAGIRDVVVSPGSRSTPLALAFAQELRIRKHVVLDERVAALLCAGTGKGEWPS